MRYQRLYLISEKPDPSFDGAWMKLDHARELLDTLRTAEAEYRAGNPVQMETIEERCADGSRVYRIIASVRQEPPAGWALIIGDVVHNSRSALDNAVWAATDPLLRGRHTAMPICDSLEAWEIETIRRRRLDGVSAQQQAIIRKYQPFHDEQPVPLSVLRDLSDGDKHRALHATALISEDEWVGSDNATVTFEHVARVIPITDQAEAMRVRATPQDPAEPMVVRPNAAYVVAIGTFAGMTDTLDSCCWFAEKIVGELEHPDRGW